MTLRSLLVIFMLTTVGLLITTNNACAADVYDSPQAALADPDFLLQGEYTGDQGAGQVIALGTGEFRAVVYRGGLPGAGFRGDKAAKQSLEGDREDMQDVLKSLNKVERKSPTLGVKPPNSAVVLFDGTKASLQKHWKNGARITADGLLQQGAASRETFTDFTLHLEFRTPFMPQARSQARGNSGVYYQGRYETQVLDSFGLEGEDNECGGLYTVRAPNVNMCLPPLAWQTYDADFTAARWDAQGKKTANARITVLLNGVIVHQNAEIPYATRAAPNEESAAPGPIYLQDHGNPVRYRNVWVLPRDAEAEARRPIVPGFERFHAHAGKDTTAGGRLLLGELNCTSCHAAGAAWQKHIVNKQAPILDKVGARVRPEYLLKFIASPHETKPGTTMPNVFSGMPANERETAVRAIVNFLQTTGKLTKRRSQRAFAKNGERLFHRIGCVACHLPRNGKTASLETSVPLTGVAEKYTIPSLLDFLRDPHVARPGGRMPSLNLNHNDARDVAHYLIGAVAGRPKTPNMRYEVYRGKWEDTPDFQGLQPTKTGQSAGLDLSVAEETANFGVHFESFLKIQQEGDYRFHLGSDDASLLRIGGEQVVLNGGVHPHTVKSESVRLTAGVHPIAVDYAQVGGEWTLELEYEGPGVPRQSIETALFLKEGVQPAPAKTPPAVKKQKRFVFEPGLVEKGRTLFTSFGCSTCHQLQQGGQRLPPLDRFPPLRLVDSLKGCLADHPSGKAPDFALTNTQRQALAGALSSGPPEAAPSPQEQISQVMVRFNCFACHGRNGVGGPEPDRNPLFLTTIPEMGDEGRTPPPLAGVGDKLQIAWLKHVLANGADDRPYMQTRMPKFGEQNVGQLADLFAKQDQPPPAQLPESRDPPHKVKAVGRFLVGDKAFSCIKCHTFGKHRATGVQAIDLQTMAKRIRQDWFHRYLPDPPRYRPGTRMPTGFPGGHSTVGEVYSGDPQRQIAAMWRYLSDGPKAGLPDGLVVGIMELKPETEPIIYRNFIDGLTPRGIAVGFPEKAHFAWDANQMCLALIWHGRFIDASLHWGGRGAGFQTPLGDDVLHPEQTSPIAELTSPDAAWPTTPAKERGYRFRGYALDKQRRPAFRYEAAAFSVRDFPIAVRDGENVSLRRRLSIQPKTADAKLYFLAGRGQKIEPLPDGWFLIDNALRVRVQAAQQPVVRKTSAGFELLAPISATAGKAEIVQELAW